MSCFVSREGWLGLARSLARFLEVGSPTTDIRLYLSLEGTLNVGRRQFVDELVAFLKRHETRSLGEDPQFKVFLVPDHLGRLFHPKGYAVRSGARFIVSVGSANLTRAAQSGNQEMELVHDDPNTHAAFVAAAQKLEELRIARRFKIPNNERLNDYLEDQEVRERALARLLAPVRNEPEPDRQLAIESVLDDVPCEPLSVDLAETLKEIREAITLGCRVVEQDFGLPNLSVSLRPFVNAGIIATPPQRPIGTGIKLGEGSATSLLISLVPDEMIQTMIKINRRQGSLLRQFTMDLLGVRWLPIGWQQQFLQHWTLCREHEGPFSLRDVDDHISRLHEDLSSPDFVRQLAKRLKPRRATSGWKTEAAIGLFQTQELVDLVKRGKSLPKSMDGILFSEIASHIRSRVLGKLDAETARFQVEHVGAPPRCDQMPPSSFEDISDFVATMSMIVTQDVTWNEPAARRSRRSRGDLRQHSGTGVRRVLVSQISRKSGSHHELRASARELRRCLTSPAPPEYGERDRLLTAVWNAFKRAFHGGHFPQNWANTVPNWAPSWLTEPGTLVTSDPNGAS